MSYIQKADFHYVIKGAAELPKKGLKGKATELEIPKWIERSNCMIVNEVYTFASLYVYFTLMCIILVVEAITTCVWYCSRDVI